MNERIKLLRKELRKTQKDFGELVGASRDVIANIENGRVTPNETFIQLLCTKFNISEHWLRTGEDNMFIETNNDLLEKLILEYHMSEAQQRIMTTFLHMDEHKREAVSQALFTFIDSLQQNSGTTASNLTVLDNEDDFELKKRQEIIANEFEAEKKGKMSLASTGINGGIKRA